VTDRDGVMRLESVKALDDLTVEYVVKDPSPMSKWDVNFTIIPKHLYEKGKAEDPTLKASPYYAQLNRNPVGCGAYRFVSGRRTTRSSSSAGTTSRAPRATSSGSSSASSPTRTCSS